MAFKDDLKTSLGYPEMDVELYENNSGVDDYAYIMNRVLRTMNTYQPLLQVVVKNSLTTDGKVLIANDNFTVITNVYAVGYKQSVGKNDSILPWSVFRLQEKAIIFPTEFIATDYSIVKNEIDAINLAFDNLFDWKEYNGYLYVTGMPSWALGIGIEGYRPAVNLDTYVNLPNDYYNIALDLAKGEAKILIGQKMRKYKVEGMSMPGEDYVKEGKDEIKDAMVRLESMSVYPGGLVT